MKLYLWILTLSFIVSSSHFAQASTTINCQVIRNQMGSGSTFVSNGFPFPKGLVTEAMITGGLIKIYVNGSEVDANVTALRGRHGDGTIRSALIQFTMPSMAQNDVISTNTYVLVDGGARTNADPTYVRPTKTIVTNNNVILPTSSTYLTSTLVTFQHLLPAGSGTAEENKLYGDGDGGTPDWADTWFDLALTYAPNGAGALSSGAASYEPTRAMINTWLTTGDVKYWNFAIPFVFANLSLDTAAAGGCSTVGYTAYAITNPDARAEGQLCGVASPWDIPRKFGYAAMYLMTGYRDFWGIVSADVQRQQWDITDQSTANTNIIAQSSYDEFRTNYSQRFGSILPALMIDATIPVTLSGVSGRNLNFSDQLTWTLNAIKEEQWDFRWIPFNSGSETVPAMGTTVSRSGGASATLLGVYTWKSDPQIFAGQPMPATGYLMVNAISNGPFTAGELTGITATSTGAEISDYREGLSGTRQNSMRRPNLEAISGSVTGTTMTVTSAPRGGVAIGDNIFQSSSGLTFPTYVLAQLTGDAGGTGTYTVSVNYGSTVTFSNIVAKTVLTNFQTVFINNFLIDYYLNVDQDAAIPGMVKKNLDIVLNNMRTLVSGDDGYNLNATSTWGLAANSYKPVYGDPYVMDNPYWTIKAGCYDLPEYVRALAFVRKTVPDADTMTVNGKSYAEWYSILIDTANVSPVNVATQYYWKTFGQMLGFNFDTPWIMAQTSLPAPSYRTPTQYDSIPSDTPDLARTGGTGTTNKWKLRAITDDQQ